MKSNPSMKSVIQPIAKIVLISLGLIAAASAADARIHKKILGSGHSATLIVSNKEMKDVLKVVRSLKDSGLLLEGASKTNKNEANKQKQGFISMLLGTLGASLLGNILSNKGVIRAGEITARVGYGSKRSSFEKKLTLPHPLTNFEMILSK